MPDPWFHCFKPSEISSGIILNPYNRFARELTNIENDNLTPSVTENWLTLDEKAAFTNRINDILLQTLGDVTSTFSLINKFNYCP